MAKPGNSAALQKHGREALQTLQSSSNKSVKFYSKAGQKRLSKIWEDLNLSEEFIFTGFVGPTDAFIREQVSDYIQNYLQLRSGWLYRTGIKMKSDLTSESKLSSDRRASYLKYNEYQRKLKNMKDAARMYSENERITKSIMDGLMDPPVLGIETIRENPIYKTNKLSESINELKQKDPKYFFNFSQKILPRITDGTKMKGSRKNVSTKPIKVTQKNIKTSNTISPKDLNKDKMLRIYTSTPNPLSRTDSVSSGFIEISPSNNLTLECDTNVFDDEESESPPTNSDYNLSEVSKKIDNLTITKMEKEKIHGISDDIDFPFTFPWESGVEEQVHESNDVPEIYETSQAIVDVYRRQMEVGNEFIEDWNSLVVKTRVKIK